MRKWFYRVSFLPLLVLAVASLSSCVDEKVVYRDRQLFEQPAGAAGDFVGYTDTVAKLTVCGNCHVEKQAEWEQTKHASAWADLQASGHASASCEGCHTVGQNGNPDSTAVGYEATGEARYHDVQCESCHGPGLTHVSDPKQSNEPLAPASVSMTTGCGECHQGTHEPFVDEWSQSMHAQENTHAEDNPNCQGCHTGEGALAAFGVNTNFLEKANLGPGNHIRITCVVCHNPHGSDNTAQLRFPIDVASVDANLCMKCHQREGVPDPSSRYGPHSPEGPTLLGTAGWIPPGMTNTGPLIGTHGNPTANPGLCATCHVQKFNVTDPNTGNLTFAATGHLFVAIPCLDSAGKPTAGDCSDSERSFKACANSGCHADQQTALNLREVADTRINNLVTELNGLLAQVPATEFDATDNKFTVGEGAKFNAQLGAKPGAPVHNPFLIEALLTASIQAVEDTYGVQPVSGSAVSLQRVLVPGVK